MSIADIAEGFANAAGNPTAVAQFEKRKDDRAATEKEQLQAQSHAIFDEVRKLQDQKLKLNPKTDQESIANIDKRLTDLQGQFTKLYHPSQNPGALAHLPSFIQEHLGKRPAPSSAEMGGTNPKLDVPKTPGQAKAQFSWAGTPAGAGAEQNPILSKRKQMQEAGFSPEMIQKVEQIDAGLAPKATASRKTMATVEPDPDSPTGYSKVVKDQISGEELSRESNVLPPRGFIGSESTTTDPFGVTSHTTRQPVIPGQTSKPAPVKTPAEAKKLVSSTAPATKQVDAQGHIPPSAKINPQLREAANQILDGMDIDKLPIPQRDRAAAAELARSYGWVGQGLFGPKDKLLIRESTGILKQLANSDSLSVLDDTGSRLKLQQVLQNPDKRGFVGQTLQTLSAGSLSPKEQEFLTLYNQAVGRISGLSQLVRSGRATEAQIERLKTELPNPATTADSAHARQKLAQIQNEIDIALEKGQFIEGQQNGKSGDTSDDDFLKKF